MHPIEHLRHVARARGVEASSLAQEAAYALGSLRADRANLVIACRRIVERHPEAGPLWWLCARLLTADDPNELAWDLADEIERDIAPRIVAEALPDAATVATIGRPDVAGAAVMRRGDLIVLCADSCHEASTFMQRLEGCDIECSPVPSEMLARATAAADLVLVDATAACPGRVLAPLGSHVLAAVARSVGTPVWLVVGIGRRLPTEYVDQIAQRLDLAEGSTAMCDADLDDLPIELITHVASAEGVSDRVTDALRPDAPLAPELLRASPF